MNASAFDPYLEAAEPGLGAFADQSAGSAGGANGSGSGWVGGRDPDEVLFQFVTEGVVLNCVGLLGLFGNLISMIILSRPQMRSSINYLLIGLARCDTVLIVTSILLFGLPAIHAYTGMLFTYQFKVRPQPPCAAP